MYPTSVGLTCCFGDTGGTDAVLPLLLLEYGASYGILPIGNSDTAAWAADYLHGALVGEVVLAVVRSMGGHRA